MTNWISVKDRLPEPWVTVMMYGGGEAVMGYLDEEGRFTEHMWDKIFPATHWMIPEPPKEESDE